MVLFFGTGIMGIVVGLFISNILLITFMGVINICVGGFVGWIFLSRKPESDRKRKKYGK